MATQSEGIQKLLEAEKAAQKEVDAARKGKIRKVQIFVNLILEKAKKLKQAKDEAKDEIKAFQADRDTEFKKVEATIMGGSDKLQNEITLKTKKEIEEMNKRVKAERKKVIACFYYSCFLIQLQVIASLVASVRNVQPELPVNFRPAIGA
jgi:V-type H+-transporting ATPase subunit G